MASMNDFDLFFYIGWLSVIVYTNGFYIHVLLFIDHDVVDVLSWLELVFYNMWRRCLWYMLIIKCGLSFMISKSIFLYLSGYKNYYLFSGPRFILLIELPWQQYSFNLSGIYQYRKKPSSITEILLFSGWA